MLTTMTTPAGPIAERLDECQRRLATLSLAIAAMLKELRDDPVRHLRPCSCGRQWTRADRCVLCRFSL